MHYGNWKSDDISIKLFIFLLSVEMIRISSCVIFQVDWGEASVIEAERILLRHALTDPYNERFVFISDRNFFRSLHTTEQLKTYGRYYIYKENSK